MDAAQNINLDSAEYDSLSWVAKRIVDTGVATKEFTDYLDDHKEDAAKWGFDTDQINKNIGTVVGSVAELGDALHGLVTFMKNDKYEYTDARKTDVGRAFNSLILSATASQPEEYNAAVNEVFKELGQVEGFLPTLERAADILIGDDPVRREVLLREIVAKEIIQEIPLFFASLGAGSAAKIAGRGLIWTGSKAAGKDAIGAATENFIKKLGGGTALGTNVVLQTAETAGANAQETYALFFDSLIETGIPEEEANVIAGEQAIINASITGGIEFVVGGLIPVRVGVEGISEVLEENAAVWHRYSVLKQIAPDASVFKEGGEYADIGNAHGIATIFGALGGTGTSASMAAAEGIYRAVTGENKPPPSSYGPPTPPTSYNTGSVSGNILLNLNPNIHNTVGDAVNSEDPEVKARAEDDIKAFFGYPLGTPAFTESNIDVTQDPDSVFRFNTTVDILNAANPDAYHTYNDVSTAFSDSEAESQIGFVPTKQDIQTFIGATLPEETSQAPLTVFKAGIDDYINANFTTPSEVSVHFNELGYSPTEEEIGQFTGQGPQIERIDSIAPYVDPRQTTADEVLDYFSGLGYEATFDEAALFAGQGGTDFEATQLPTIDPYVDPRQVTQSEAEAYFRAQGYTPTEDEINRFVAQANDPTFQATQGQKLAEEFDPLAVIPEEARQAYETAGFFGALDPDVERLAGQYPESELESRVQDALPVATYNSIANMLGKPGQEVTQADVSFVADIIAQNEVGQELADTASPAPLSQEQLIYDVTGDNIIDIADQTMLEQVMAGTVPQTDIASESAFAATGVQGQLQQQTQLQQQMQTQMQTQIQEDERRRAAQREQQYMQSLLETSPAEVKTPDARPIEYTYDPFGESIFATPKQEQMFSTATPYAAKGGLVKNTTDEILEIMRGG